MRSLSLTARLLISTSFVLSGFVVITGVILDNAFRDSALVAVQQHLQAQVYILLGAADIDTTDDRLSIPDALPEARFSMPGSGLYAVVVNREQQAIWRSRSLLGTSLGPLPMPGTPGIGEFYELQTTHDERLFGLGFSVSWEVHQDQYQRYTFWVAETHAAYDAQVSQFRRSLWTWLLAAASVLLIAQLAVLRWSLQPLRRIASQVREIETGQRQALSGRYPAELEPLAKNLNALIDVGRAALERYRNAIGDLAHSLKTPLAVVRNTLSSRIADHENLQNAIGEQVGRMNATIDYHLQRAAAGGRITLGTRISVAETAQKIVQSLGKVYFEKQLRIDLRIDAACFFFGDQGDLMEILGNLADNACKWASSRVLITASSDQQQITITIEDDGPGIKPDQREGIIDRFARADPRTPGHGLGLSVVHEIVVNVYHGEIRIDDSSLGGARLCVRIGHQ